MQIYQQVGHSINKARNLFAIRTSLNNTHMHVHTHTHIYGMWLYIYTVYVFLVSERKKETGRDSYGGKTIKLFINLNSLKQVLT